MFLLSLFLVVCCHFSSDQGFVLVAEEAGRDQSVGYSVGSEYVYSVTSTVSLNDAISGIPKGQSLNLHYISKVSIIPIWNSSSKEHEKILRFQVRNKFVIKGP